MLGFVLPGRLFGRLCLLFAIVAFEYLFCFWGRGTVSGHLKLFAVNTVVYGEIPLFACMVFLAFGYSQLKAQQEAIPFSRRLFAGHLVCLAAVLCFTMAMHGYEIFGALLFDTFSYSKSALYLLDKDLAARVFVQPMIKAGAN